jgi:hypothetical protein
MYNIDYIRLLLVLIPELLQFPIIVGYLNALITPIKIVHGEFIAKRTNTLYMVSLNGQVCYMEKALNNGFDNTERRIYITDGNRYNRLYMYTHVEEKPYYISEPLYIYNRNDYADTAVDFIVHVPEEIKTSISIYEFKALINFCALTSKRYEIVYE